MAAISNLNNSNVGNANGVNQSAYVRKGYSTVVASEERHAQQREVVKDSSFVKISERAKEMREAEAQRNASKPNQDEEKAHIERVKEYHQTDAMVLERRAQDTKVEERVNEARHKSDEEFAKRINVTA